MLPKLHLDEDYPCSLVGNWNTWYGEQDQAGEVPLSPVPLLPQPQSPTALVSVCLPLSAASLGVWGIVFLSYLIALLKHPLATQCSQAAGEA